MCSRRFFPGLLLLFLLAIAGVASAQTWSPEQQEIWRFEELQWKMALEKDLTWIDKMVHPNLSYWDVDRPAPLNKAGLTRWNRYTIARENYKKDRETASGRYTDILIKDGGR